LNIFGGVNGIEMINNNSAKIYANSILQAYIIHNQLNAKFIKDLNAYIEIEWDTTMFDTYLN